MFSTLFRLFSWKENVKGKEGIANLWNDIAVSVQYPATVHCDSKEYQLPRVRGHSEYRLHKFHG